MQTGAQRLRERDYVTWGQVTAQGLGGESSLRVLRDV